MKFHYLSCVEAYTYLVNVLQFEQQETDIEAMSKRVSDALTAFDTSKIYENERHFALAKELGHEVLIDEYIVPIGEAPELAVKFKSLTHKFMVTLASIEVDGSYIFNLSRLDTKEGSDPIEVSPLDIETKWQCSLHH